MSDYTTLRHCVYLIVDTVTDLCKIGLTDSIDKRWRQIQRAEKNRIVPQFIFYVDKRKDAFILESALHRKYKHLRRRGEWFRVDPRRVTRELYADPELAHMVKHVSEMPEWGEVITEISAVDRFVYQSLVIFIVAFLMSTVIWIGESNGEIDMELYEVVGFAVIWLVSLIGMVGTSMAILWYSYK